LPPRGWFSRRDHRAPTVAFHREWQISSVHLVLVHLDEKPFELHPGEFVRVGEPPRQVRVAQLSPVVRRNAVAAKEKGMPDEQLETRRQGEHQCPTGWQRRPASSMAASTCVSAPPDASRLTVAAPATNPPHSRGGADSDAPGRTADRLAEIRLGGPWVGCTTSASPGERPSRLGLGLTGAQRDETRSRPGAPSRRGSTSPTRTNLRLVGLVMQG